MRQKKILAVCHDIGGAQALFPVVKSLIENGDWDIKVIVGHFAHKLYQPFDVKFVHEDLSNAETSQYLDQFQPDLLLTSTSWKSSLEQTFRNQCRQRAIPSVVILDFWSNYQLRWQHANYAFSEGVDYVCVMDELTAQAMQREGYPNHKIYVTGHPHLEQLASSPMTKPPAREHSHEERVLLLTINLEALELGCKQLDFLKVISQGLSVHGKTTGTEIALTVRQHPHEKDDPNFLNQAKATLPENIRIELADKTMSLHSQIESHDQIIGYMTMALFEARCLHKKALVILLSELAPELNFALENSGIARTTLDHFAQGLAAFQNTVLDAPRMKYQGATASVIDLCGAMITNRILESVDTSL